tara:strand:- start:471 stop:698 length:228 start_codon:yes stop_codon:yes gene_type:complete
LAEQVGHEQRQWNLMGLFDQQGAQYPSRFFQASKREKSFQKPTVITTGQFSAVHPVQELGDLLISGNPVARFRTL